MQSNRDPFPSETETPISIDQDAIAQAALVPFPELPAEMESYSLALDLPSQVPEEPFLDFIPYTPKPNVVTNSGMLRSTMNSMEFKAMVMERRCKSLAKENDPIIKAWFKGEIVIFTDICEAAPTAMLMYIIKRALANKHPGLAQEIWDINPSVSTHVYTLVGQELNDLFIAMIAHKSTNNIANNMWDNCPALKEGIKDKSLVFTMPVLENIFIKALSHCLPKIHNYIWSHSSKIRDKCFEQKDREFIKLIIEYIMQFTDQAMDKLYNSGSPLIEYLNSLNEKEIDTYLTRAIKSPRSTRHKLTVALQPITNEKCLKTGYTTSQSSLRPFISVVIIDRIHELQRAQAHKRQLETEIEFTTKKPRSDFPTTTLSDNSHALFAHVPVTEKTETPLPSPPTSTV